MGCEAAGGTRRQRVAKRWCSGRNRLLPCYIFPHSCCSLFVSLSSDFNFIFLYFFFLSSWFSQGFFWFLFGGGGGRVDEKKCFFLALDFCVDCWNWNPYQPNRWTRQPRNPPSDKPVDVNGRKWIQMLHSSVNHGLRIFGPKPTESDRCPALFFTTMNINL